MEDVERSLTEEEIEDILLIIKPNRGLPRATADSIVEINRSKVRAQLVSIKVFPAVIPKLKKEIERHYLHTTIQPGESVGVITAQSIGERQTQNTLNTFHSCGLAIKTVVTGVPRFSELLNATRDPKAVNCSIYFKEKKDSIEGLRQIIGNQFAENKLGSLVKKRSFFTEPKIEEWYEMWSMFNGSEYEKYTHGISFEINTTKTYEFSISLEMVARKISESFGDAVCVWSPDQIGVIDVTRFSTLSKRPAPPTWKKSSNPPSRTSTSAVFPVSKTFSMKVKMVNGWLKQTVATYELFSHTPL
jgi:hypothetical protein